MLPSRPLLFVPIMLGLASISWGLYGATQGAPGPALQPDVLLITLCSVRADHVHSYGYGPETTPNIDRLAASGTTYTNAFAAGGWTGSSHASMLTGVLPALHGVLDFGQTISPVLPTLPEILGTYGYSTGAFQSAHGPMTFGVTDGSNRGFATFETEFSGSAELAGRVGAWWRQVQHPAFALVHLREAHAPFGLTSDLAGARRDKRIVGWQQSAFRPGPEGAGATSRLARDLAGDEALHAELLALYDQGVRAADAQVGAILDAVEPDPARTLVIVTGDHGEALGEGGHLGHKRYHDEGVIRVPLVVRYPATNPEPRVVETEVGLTDLLPTVLDLAAIVPPALLDGRTLLGLGDAERWRLDLHDPRVRPSIAQVTDSMLGETAPVNTVVVTADWRLEDADGAGRLYARSGEGWARVDEPSVLQALKRRYLGVATLSPPTQAQNLAPEALEVLRRNGYW